MGFLPVYLSLPSPSNYNVIAVDWGELSSLAGGYDAAFANTRLVGKEIANLMKTLIVLGKSQLADFHFIGIFEMILHINLRDGQNTDFRGYYTHKKSHNTNLNTHFVKKLSFYRGQDVLLCFHDFLKMKYFDDDKKLISSQNGS